jgi:hypothetical protein
MTKKKSRKARLLKFVNKPEQRFAILLFIVGSLFTFLQPYLAPTVFNNITIIQGNTTPHNIDSSTSLGVTVSLTTTVTVIKTETVTKTETKTLDSIGT